MTLGTNLPGRLQVAGEMTGEAATFRITALGCGERGWD